MTGDGLARCGVALLVLGGGEALALWGAPGLGGAALMLAGLVLLVGARLPAALPGMVASVFAAAAAIAGDVEGAAAIVLGTALVTAASVDRAPWLVGAVAGSVVLLSRQRADLALIAPASTLSLGLYALLGGVGCRGGRAGLAAPAGLLIGAAASVSLFFAIPRLPRPMAAPPPPVDGATTGFEPEVDLTDAAPLLDDDGIAFRVVPLDGPASPPIRLRGAVFGSFDGQRWGPAGASRSFEADSGGRRYRIEPSGPPTDGTVFAPGFAVDVSLPVVVTDDGDALIATPPPTDPYVVTVAATRPVRDVTPFLALPALDPRVPALAADLAGLGEPTVRLAALEAGLQGRARYDRAPAAPGADPLVAFLFDGAPGHCEHFATSYAVLARSIGVPARVVVGFRGGTVDEEGAITIRRDEAHAWVEVAVDGEWRVVDPTPPGAAPPEPTWSEWWDAALALDWGGQVAAARRLAPLALALAAAGLALRFIVAAWGRPRLGRVATAHARVRAAFARRGFAPPEDLPPVEAAGWLVERAPEAADGAVELAWLLYGVRYGGVADRDAAPQAEALARDLVRRARTARRPARYPSA